MRRAACSPLLIALIGLCLALPAHGGKHLYGVGNWIRESELEHGRRILIDFGDGRPIEEGLNIGIPPKESFVIFRVTAPMEDDEDIHERVPTGPNSYKLMPKKGGVLIKAVYVLKGKEQEFFDKVCVPTSKDYEYYEKHGNPLTEETIRENIVDYASKRVEIVLAEVNGHWVGVYR